MPESEKAAGLIIIDFEGTLDCFPDRQFYQLFDCSETKCKVAVVTEYRPVSHVENYLYSRGITPKACLKIMPRASKGDPGLYRTLTKEAGVSLNHCIYIDNNPAYAIYAYQGGTQAVQFSMAAGAPAGCLYLPGRPAALNNRSTNPQNLGKTFPLIYLINNITGRWVEDRKFTRAVTASPLALG
jgi:hypothetical protein